LFGLSPELTAHRSFFVEVSEVSLGLGWWALIRGWAVIKAEFFLKAVFWLGMVLTQISRSRFKRARISPLIPRIYVLRCFVNFLVIMTFGYFWG